MTTSIEPIRINPGMKINVLSDDDIQQLHQATLAILAETGVRLP